MSEHLTKEEIERLSKKALRGDELIAALKHIENCDECRLKIELPRPEEVLDRLGINLPKK